MPGKLREKAQRSALSLSLSSMVDGKEELPQNSFLETHQLKAVCLLGDDVGWKSSS
jgi:hypothetical protein